MALNLQLGKQGEHLAEAYLLNKGYIILYRNWRFTPYEVDIIALKNNIPHLVEVKLRTSDKFGLPEDNVTKKKIRSLLNAAEEFLYQHPQYKHFQLDVLSILLLKNKEPEYFLIEDVYV